MFTPLHKNLSLDSKGVPELIDRFEPAACDWWHGLPQLFWEFFFEETGIPSSCAQVQLVPVAV